MVHRRTGGIPRLVNLVCDRSLLAAYSAGTTRVSADMVHQAAENLELVESRPSRFSWFRRRASVVVIAAGGMATPVLRAYQSSQASETAAAAVEPVATPAVQAVAAEAPVPMAPSISPAPEAARRYAVLTASFPVLDVSRAGSTAEARFNGVVGQLKGLGYDVRLMDIDLNARGEWRRVLVGEFSTLEEARNEAARLHQVQAFSDAQPIKF